MKNKHLFLMLLLAFFVPWAANAQETLPVYEDGTETSQKIPLDGFNADGAQHNQMIYPATVLNDMNGGEISQMVFYSTATMVVIQMQLKTIAA